MHVVEIFKISSLLWEARFVMNGCAFGRHLQPTSRDYYSLHKTPEDAKDRYSWWADEQRPSDVFFLWLSDATLPPSLVPAPKTKIRWFVDALATPGQMASCTESASQRWAAIPSLRVVI